MIVVFCVFLFVYEFYGYPCAFIVLYCFYCFRFASFLLFFTLFFLCFFCVFMFVIVFIVLFLAFYSVSMVAKGCLLALFVWCSNVSYCFFVFFYTFVKCFACGLFCVVIVFSGLYSLL